MPSLPGYRKPVRQHFIGLLNMRDFSNNVLGNMASNLLWQGIIILLPIASLFFSKMNVLSISPTYMNFILGGGWTATLVIAAIWYRNHTARQAERFKDFQRLLTVADEPLFALIIERLGKLSPPDIRTEVAEILTLTCQVVQHRTPAREKGASLLLLANDHFELYVQQGHGRTGLLQDIQQLTLANSLAGQALELDEPRAIDDCHNPPAGARWKSNSRSQRFRGRVAIPVQALSKDSTGVANIGVLCFDTERTLKLPREDLAILLMVADKIASLWVLCSAA